MSSAVGVQSSASTSRPPPSSSVLSVGGDETKAARERVTTSGEKGGEGGKELREGKEAESASALVKVKGSRREEAGERSGMKAWEGRQGER